MRILDKPKPLSKVGAAWLDAVKTGKLGNERKTVAVAGEVARLVRGDGRGELASPIDLVVPIGLGEGDAVDAIGRLIVNGFVVLEYRPFMPCRPFFVRPGPFAAPDKPTKARTAEDVVAAAGSLPLADAISGITEGLARLLAADGVDPAKPDGAHLLETAGKLLNQRVTALLASRIRKIA